MKPHASAALPLPVLFLVSMLLPATAAAQTGTVSGSVRSEQDEPIPLATVVIEGTSLGAVTDQSGSYVIRGVPAGRYTMTASAFGYRSASETEEVSEGGEDTQGFVLSQDFLGMETIVATAQREPRIKLETSTAITTLTPRDIQREAPRSTADLLKTVPGFYVESSGGEVQGNLFARGLPADGSFRYVALLEDGMPVYDATELFFVNADIFVRVDNNLRQVEAVRGGSAALFGSNAPGGLVNYLSRTGGPARSGIVTVKGGSDGYGKIDANINGPLSQNWRYSIGGFFRSDEGVRDPGFTSSQGGQIKANVTRQLANGYVRFYGKYLNDENVFYLPLPLQNPPDPQFVPGFPEDGTLTSDAGIDRTVPLPGGGSINLPLDDGVHQEGGWFQADLGLDFGDGWSVENKFRWMDIDHGNVAMVPGGAPEDAEDFAETFVEDTPGAAGFRYTFADTGEPFDTPNNLLNPGIEWRVDKPLSNVSDQFSLRKTAGRHEVTVGTYLGRHDAENTWYFNDVLTNIENAPQFVDLEILDAEGNVIQRVTDNGFRQYVSLFVEGDGHVNLVSFFAGDEIALNENFDVDLGVRYEHNSIEHEVSNTEEFDLPGGTDAHTGVNFRDGTTTLKEDDFDEWAFSVGGNYRLNEQVAIFGRGTAGYKMPHLDQYLFSDPGDLETELVNQIEGGIKVSSPKLGLSAVAYWLKLTDFPIQDAQIDPVTGDPVFLTTFAGEARTLGTEIEVVAAPVPALRLNGTATFQNPEFQELNITEDDVLVSLEGNRVRRIPQVILNLGADVEVGSLTLLGDWNIIGDRFSNNENTITLDSYSIFHLGAEYRLPLYGITLLVDWQNVGDAGAEALTEGNPRIDESLGAQQSLFFARPVLPQRVTAGISYEF